MSRWIRGRQRRPIASIISVVMLVVLLMSTSLPPVMAETIDLTKFFGTDIKSPSPIVVLDFTNHTGYQTGMLGRTIADALSIELINTKSFEVIKRSQVEKVLTEYNLTQPLTVEAQAMVADRLKCAFVITGDIASVEIHRGRDGTYAEIEANAVVLSRVIKQPINGARAVQRSSPKIGYSGNTDVLVHEALTTAAYQIAQRILDNRLPIATVLTSVRNGEVICKGGSTIGFRKGMILVTVRRESVTGKLRLTEVSPTECFAEVMEESKGIAPGDKGVPVYESVQSERFTKDKREKAALQIAGVGLLGILAVLVGTENHTKKLSSGATLTATAAPMSDAAYNNELDGANLVRWPYMGGRVVADIIYRDTNLKAPIAVVDGTTTYYVDSAKPLNQPDSVMEDTTVTITIDPASGELDEFNWETTYATELDELENPDMTFSNEDFDITCHRVPLQIGDTVGYQIRMLYMDYNLGDLSEGELGHPDEYRLFLGNRGPVTPKVALTPPPTLTTPGTNQVPLDGSYRCERIPNAFNYQLQISTDPSFPNVKGTTYAVTAMIESEASVIGTFPLGSYYDTTSPDPPIVLPTAGSATPIYWRMGARISGTTPVALIDTVQNGWVYSETRTFLLPAVPPEYLRQRGLNGQIYLPGKTNAGGRTPGRSRAQSAGRGN